MQKTFHAPIGLKDAGEDGAAGTFSAVIALFDTPDLDHEIVRQSFFTDGQHIPIAQYGHDWNTWPIGDGTIHVTPDAAIVNGQLWLDTPQGQHAYTSLKRAGDLQQWSFGFTVTGEGLTQVDGQSYRELTQGEIHEASPVFLGAQPLTQTLSLKSAAPPADRKRAWSGSYINSLPDSAFALVEGGGSKDDQGKTTPRSLRHFPHHDAGGAVDLPHVRNGLSRAPQSNLSETQINRAASHLRDHLDASKRNRLGQRPRAAPSVDFEGRTMRSHKDLMVEAPEDSWEDIAEDIAEAFSDLYANGAYVTTVATYPTYAFVMVCDEDADMMDDDEDEGNAAEEPRYFRVDYTLDADLNPILANPQEVEAHATFTAVGGGPAGDGGMTSVTMKAARRSLKTLGVVMRQSRRRRKEGRTISQQRRARMGDILAALRDAADEIETLLKETEPPQKAEDGEKARQLRAEFLVLSQEIDSGKARALSARSISERIGGAA